MCTKFHVDTLKKFWYFEVKNCHVSRCVLGLFRVFDEKLPYLPPPNPNPKFLVWPSLPLWPRMILTLNLFTESLGWYLSVSLTRSMLFYRLLSIWYGFSVRQKPDTPNHQTCDFDLSCDVIDDPEVNIVEFSSINFPNLSNAFEFCKSV